VIVTSLLVVSSIVFMYLMSLLLMLGLLELYDVYFNWSSFVECYILGNHNLLIIIFVHVAFMH